MKPVSLEFCGINSFSEPQKVNFEELLKFGIFGIFGDTGSGKSTILDCIGFALYGEVARARSGKIADIINYAQERAFVNFEFDIDYEGKRRRYRVERELKRKNAAQSLRIYEYDKAAYLCVADAVRQGNELLKEIVGLEQKDFEKCIALPQGEFAQFVKSARADRLKLVSRLFDLERYGEELVARTNNAFREASSSVLLLEARLAPYANISKEGNENLRAQAKELKEKAELFKRKLDAAKNEEKRVSALYEKHREAETLKVQYTKLKAELAEIEILEGELGRLDKAEAVKKAEGELLKAARAKKEAEESLDRAKKSEATSAEKERIAAAWDLERAEKEISHLTEERVRAEERQKTAELAAEIKAKLNASREEYRRLKDKFSGFDYEKQKEKILSKISALGNSRLTEQMKASLFREEYAVFKRELDGIEAKFPETGEVVRPLSEKYAELSKGEKVDFAAWERESEARERMLNAENERLQELERVNGDYKAHLIRLQGLQDEGLRLKEELEKAEKKMLEKAPSLAETDLRITKLKREVKERAQAKDAAVKEHAAAQSELAVAVQRVEAETRRHQEADARLKEALASAKLSSTQEADALLNKYGDAEQAKAKAAKFREEYARVKAGYENLKDAPSVTEEELLSVRKTLQEAESEHEEHTALLALKKDELKRAEAALEEKRALEKESGAALKEKALYERLKKLLESNKFMEFVAEEYLVTVALNASHRLLTLTNGQYFLKYDKGFFVGDNLHGGALRGVNTLSGGEIFLVSLSLALALSAEICARSLRSSEFFFLDEGFGTLDAKLVDTVMDSLEKLKGEHFSIGIISHVEELKHRIGRKLIVKRATEKRGSQITTE